MARFVHDLLDNRRQERLRILDVGSREVYGRGMGPVRVFAHTRGSYFFAEIADLLQAGLVAAGYPCERCCEFDELAPSARWNVVVAPHEFFTIAADRTRVADRIPANLLMVDTEKPGTHWFEAGARFFEQAVAILDIDRAAARAISSMGHRAFFLPLGYLPGFASYSEVACLPASPATRHLPETIASRSFLDCPLAERPIDLLFVGSVSPRREQFFSRLAYRLGRLRTYLHLWNAREPAIAGVNTAMDTRTAIGLAQRAKVVLNIHASEEPYFEWHRVVHHGIWQRALVLSEPCRDVPLFEAGRDFVAVELESMADRIESLLSTADGLETAQQIARRGFETLTRPEAGLAHVLADILTELS